MLHSLGLRDKSYYSSIRPKADIYATVAGGAGTFRHQPFGRQKISAHLGDNNVAQMSRQICSHTPSALNAGAERRAIWPCLKVATWRRGRSDRGIQQIS